MKTRNIIINNHRRIARLLLLAFAATGLSALLSSCSTPAQRQDARVDARVDNRVDRRHDKFD